MPAHTTLLVDALAVWRLWRLAAHDSILDRPRDQLRDWAFRRAREAGRTGIPPTVTLLACPWCLGFWLSLAAVITRRYLPAAWNVIRDIAAISSLVGLLDTLEERLTGR